MTPGRAASPPNKPRSAPSSPQEGAGAAANAGGGVGSSSTCQPRDSRPVPLSASDSALHGRGAAAAAAAASAAAPSTSSSSSSPSEGSRRQNPPPQLSPSPPRFRPRTPSPGPLAGAAGSKSSPLGAGGGTQPSASASAASASASAFPMLAGTDLCTTMWKRRGGFGRNAENNWVQRCFLLHGPILTYYDTPAMAETDPSRPRRRLNLMREDTRSEMQTTYGTHAPTEFLVNLNLYVLGSKRKWELCAGSATEQRAWYDALRRYDGQPEFRGPEDGAVAPGRGTRPRIYPATEAPPTPPTPPRRGGPTPTPTPKPTPGRRAAVVGDRPRNQPPPPSPPPPLPSYSAAAAAAGTGSSPSRRRKNRPRGRPAQASSPASPPPTWADPHVLLSFVAINVALRFAAENGGGGGRGGGGGSDATLLAAFLSNLVLFFLVSHLVRREELRWLRRDWADGSGGGGGGDADRWSPQDDDVVKREAARPAARRWRDRRRRAAREEAGGMAGGGGGGSAAPAPRASSPSAEPPSSNRRLRVGSTLPRAPAPPGSEAEGVLDDPAAGLVRRGRVLAEAAAAATAGVTAASASSPGGGGGGGEDEDDPAPNPVPAAGYDDSHGHTYWNVDPSLISLRAGPNYRKTGRKAPSGPALYDLHSMDVIEDDCCLRSIEQGFVLPDAAHLDTGHPDVPPMFVITVNIPTNEPAMFGDPDDGPSCVVIFVLTIAEGTLKELRGGDPRAYSPALRLFVEYCRGAGTDEALRSRLKAMAYVEDLEKLGLPSFIAGYNGKPALITKSGHFQRHPTYIEMTVNVHRWGYLARKGLHLLRPDFPRMVMNIGFTIEGRSDEELPEVLLGGCRMIRFDLERVAQAPGSEREEPDGWGGDPRDSASN